MEIIFESVKERDEFFEDHCPHCVEGTTLTDEECYNSNDCKKCWEQSGVKYRIKNQPTPDHPVPIEEQMTNMGAIKASVWNAWTTMKPGDKLVKTNTGWYIERKKEEPKKQVYISTASHPDPLVERMLKNMLNTAYGKDGVRPFVVMPRHQGGTAAHKMIDDFRMMLDEPSEYPGVEFRNDDLIGYIKNDVQICMDAFRRSQEERRKLQIEKVIFNNPATIVFWKDGTKTVVKCQKGDIYDEEKGLAMAICKKVFGNGSGYYEEFKKWLPEKKTIEDDLRALIRDAIAQPFEITAPKIDFKPFEYSYITFGTKPIQTRGVVKIDVTTREEEKKEERNCRTCVNYNRPCADGPCHNCNAMNNFPNFEVANN